MVVRENLPLLFLTRCRRINPRTGLLAFGLYGGRLPRKPAAEATTGRATKGEQLGFRSRCVRGQRAPRFVLLPSTAEPEDQPTRKTRYKGSL